MTSPSETETFEEDTDPVTMETDVGLIDDVSSGLRTSLSRWRGRYYV